MFVKCLIVAAACASVVQGRSAVAAPQNALHAEGATGRSEEGAGYMGDLRYVYRVYKECSAADLTSCLKLKLLAALDRAARAYTDINLVDGVSFVKDGKAAAADPAVPKSEEEIEATLPRSLDERDQALNSMIADRISDFFDSHTLQVKLPSATDLQRSFSEEGRGKKKKGGSMMILPLILGGTLIPLALGALALLAGKALIVSKLALVLAGIIGLKKLLSGGGSSHDAGHVEVVSGHGSGWGRSYEKEQAQNLAYSAYAQKTR